MTAQEPEPRVDVTFSHADLELIRVALRHLLASEDDPETIEELKALLARLAERESA